LKAAEANCRGHVNCPWPGLESIQAAVAIYGADKRLSFFNAAFAPAVGGSKRSGSPASPSLDETVGASARAPPRPGIPTSRLSAPAARMFTWLIEPQTEIDASAGRPGR